MVESQHYERKTIFREGRTLKRGFLLGGELFRVEFSERDFSGAGGIFLEGEIFLRDWILEAEFSVGKSSGGKFSGEVSSANRQ